MGGAPIRDLPSKSEVKNITLSSNNYNIINVKNEILHDIDKNGRIIDWQLRKVKTLELADSYRRLGSDFKGKQYRVRDCGTFLEFRRYQEQGMLKKLNKANFCKVRLCPMCSWRRSLKIYGQVSKIMDYLDPGKYAFLFLTLTTRNCDGFGLSETIDLIFNSFNRMTRKKVFKQSVKGYFRALEVTHNIDVRSISFDTYHPHLHVILVVNQSYFTDKRYYISQEVWTDLWWTCLGVDYKPIVDIRRFRNNKGKGIAEVAKYSVKSTDYIIRDKSTQQILEAMTDSAVFVLDLALAHRRLTSFGGLLKDIHKKLNLDDPVDGDLVVTDNDDIREDLGYIIEQYCWHIGYKQYLKVGEEVRDE